MRFSRFFIDRPIFAAVLSIIVLTAGLLAIVNLPVSEYPEVVPPTIAVRAAYPGANPTVLAQTVGTPLEESINGVDNMLYMSSQATADGVLNLTVTFNRKSTRLNSSHRSQSRMFFNDTATTEIYTLSLHDALPISRASRTRCCACRRRPRSS